MKVYELTEFKAQTTQADVDRAQQIANNVKQANSQGDAQAAMAAGAELGDMLMNKTMPDMIRFMEYAVRELDKACKQYANDPNWAEQCKQMPQLKAELAAMKKQAMQDGVALGRQDVGEGRLKSKSYKKSKKAAKASGRRRKKNLRDDVNETATGMGAASIASVSGNVGTMQSRNMYNDDGTMKNGVDFDNLLGGKKKTKKKQKTA